MINLDAHILNKLNAAAARSNKRAKAFGIASRITGEELLGMLLAQNGMCCICDVQMHIGNMTVEHMVDMSKGGTNDASNVALSCFTCNTAKAAVKPKYKPSWHHQMGWHGKQITKAKRQLKELDQLRLKLEDRIAVNIEESKKIYRKVLASDYSDSL